jgi:hypothetical protein
VRQVRGAWRGGGMRSCIMLTGSGLGNAPRRSVHAPQTGACGAPETSTTHGPQAQGKAFPLLPAAATPTVTGSRSSLTLGIRATALTLSLLRPRPALHAAAAPARLLLLLLARDRTCGLTSDAHTATWHLECRVRPAAGTRPRHTLLETFQCPAAVLPS